MDEDCKNFGELNFIQGVILALSPVKSRSTYIIEKS
jgi:hypothetical protein